MLNAQRLRIISFLQHNYGLAIKKVDPFLNGVQNSNYKINSDNGEFVFRIYNRKKINELHYTIKLLNRLQVESFPSPRLVVGKSGEIVREFEGLPCLLYHYLPGEPTEAKAERLLEQIGELQGKMHLALRDEKSELVQQNWDPVGLNEIISQNQERLNFEYPTEQERIHFIIKQIKQLFFSDQLPKGGTHQDIKAENVLVDKNRTVSGLVDFDNGYFGTLLHDITTTIIWYCFDNNKLNLELLKSFLNGYERMRTLTDLEKNNFYNAVNFRFLREVIVWYLYVGHNKERAMKTADYFFNLYDNFSIKEQALIDFLWT